MRNHRRTGCWAVLVTLMGVVLTLTTAPATAAEDDPAVSIVIDQLAPLQLTKGAAITIGGEVTNNNDHVWTNVQAYLVIPRSPFTTRGQVEDATVNERAYTGERIVDLDTIDMMGDLAAGETRRFKVKVPYNRLGLTGTEGIYPVGVQILATDDQGVRSNDAVARSTTFLPMLSKGRPVVPTTVVWPFLMPDHLDSSNTYAQPTELLKSIQPGGQLRNLLTVAIDSPTAGSTIIIDPALVVGLDDLAHGRHLKKTVELSDSDVAELNSFIAELTSLSRRGSTWILGFGRPDVLAMSQHPDLVGPLQKAIQQATEGALDTFQLTGRSVTWPSPNGVTEELLTSQRDDGEKPVIVAPRALPRWNHGLGSLVQFDTSDGAVPVLIDDSPSGTVRGTASVVRLRQRLLSEAALSSLQRSTAPSSLADAVVVVDPTWNPAGELATGSFAAALDAPYVDATTLEQKFTQAPSTVPDMVASATAKPLSRTYLEAVSELATRASSLASVMTDSEATDSEFARSVANVMALHWRSDQQTGIDIAHARTAAASTELARIHIEAPKSVTLSSNEGRFPLTVGNDTSSDVSIRIDLDSSNPALRLPPVTSIDIAAGERRTITVDIDMKQQNFTTVTAQLAANNGQHFGSPVVFNVRSSNVGATLWVAMALATAFVAAALVRRFRRRSNGHPRPGVDGHD